MMSDMEALSKLSAAEITQKVAPHVDAKLLQEMPIESMDWFKYTDPVDSQVSDHQGVRLFLKGGSRIIWRLSGNFLSRDCRRRRSRTMKYHQSCSRRLS